MPRFSRNQAKLASALVKNAKTAKDLRNELGLPLNEIESDLAKLINLKVVEKLGGYPTRYQTIESVRRGVMTEEPTEAHVFRAHAIIEGQSVEKAALEGATQQLIKQMETDGVIVANNIVADNIVHEENIYRNMIEADIATKRFEDLVYFALTYGPSSLEVLPFEPYMLKPDEAQGVVMDVASALHSYAAALVEKDLVIQHYRKKSPEVFLK